MRTDEPGSSSIKKVRHSRENNIKEAPIIHRAYRSLTRVSNHFSFPPLPQSTPTSQHQHHHHPSPLQSSSSNTTHPSLSSPAVPTPQSQPPQNRQHPSTAPNHHDRASRQPSLEINRRRTQDVNTIHRHAQRQRRPGVLVARLPQVRSQHKVAGAEEAEGER